MIKFFLILLSFSSFSAEQIWVINPDHSEITFKIPYLKISSISGRFTKFNGHARFNNDEDPLPSKIKLMIKASSINTANKMRDGHLKSADFFDAKNFPLIRFESQEITPIDESHYQVVGDLKLKESRIRASISYSLSDDIEDTWQKKNRFIHFNFKIKLKDFFLDWNKNLKGGDYLIGDEVEVQGVFQLQPRGEKTQPSQYMIPNTVHLEHRDQVRLGDADPNKLDSSAELTSERSKVEAKKEPPNSSKMQVSPPKKTESIPWKISFLLLGFFAFCGVIALSYWIKIYFSNKVSKYEETNLWGFLSDIPTLVIFLIFTITVWIVGWGY